MTTSLEQIIQFLNNLSYITYVGIQYWEKNRAYAILFYIRRNLLLGKNRAYVKKGTTGGIEIWGRQQKKSINI
jgi:hypothetical protein